MKNKIIIIVVTLTALLIAGYMFSMMKGNESNTITIENDKADVNNIENQIQTSEINKNDSDNTEKKLKEYQKNINNNKLSRLYIVKCAACHGKDGKGIIGLPITGKSYDYNYEALLKYKNGQVKNSLMKGLLENTPDDELKALAEEISRFE